MTRVIHATSYTDIIFINKLLYNIMRRSLKEQDFTWAATQWSPVYVITTVDTNVTGSWCVIHPENYMVGTNALHNTNMTGTPNEVAAYVNHTVTHEEWVDNDVLNPDIPKNNSNSSWIEILAKVASVPINEHILLDGDILSEYFM